MGKSSRCLVQHPEQKSFGTNVSTTQDKFYLLFEQEIQTWLNFVVSKVDTQCTNMKFVSTTCNTCEIEKNHQIIMLTVNSVYDNVFFFSLQ